MKAMKSDSGHTGVAPAVEVEPGLWLRGTVPARSHFRLADYKLAAFDMDSTLISIECIDEIAAAAGRKAEVAAITEAAMRGEIADYSQSLQQRLALLRGIPESALLDVYEQRLRLNPGVETFVAACRAAGLKTLLVSGGFTFFADRVRQRLRIDFVRANVLELAAGQLTGQLVTRPWGEVVDGAEKRRVLLEVAELMGIDATQTIAVGDGANDLPMMAAAGFSIAFHAKPAVREQATLSITQGGIDRALVVLRA
jgi:phosphoserine phosphatase